ncbi:hypothetical protein ACFL1H_03405, partial [Nanoarchaeota archaeon]
MVKSRETNIEREKKIDAVQRRIISNDLKEFEKGLNELNKIDLKIFGDIKEIHRQSFIFKHKFLIIPVVKEINYEK